MRYQFTLQCYDFDLVMCLCSVLSFLCCPRTHHHFQSALVVATASLVSSSLRVTALPVSDGVQPKDSAVRVQVVNGCEPPRPTSTAGRYTRTKPDAKNKLQPFFFFFFFTSDMMECSTEAYRCCAK